MTKRVIFIFLLSGLLLSCGDAPVNDSVFNALPTATAPSPLVGATDSICNKLSFCGALKFDDMPRGVGIDGKDAPSPVEVCVSQVRGGLDQAAEVPIDIPWEALVGCLTASPCSSLSNIEAMTGVLMSCAKQLGIDVTLPDNPRPPEYQNNYNVSNNSNSSNSSNSTNSSNNSNSSNNTGDNVCIKALAKLGDCLDSVDCGSLDTMQQQLCEQTKKATSEPVPPGAKCEGEDKTKAEMMLECDLDPEKICLACK